MTFFRQLFTVTRMGLSTLPSRAGDSMVVLIGMACAVGALLSVLSLSAGVLNMLGHGRADRAVVLSQSAQYEGASTITRPNAGVIANAPGIKKTAADRPIISAETIAGVAAVKKKDGFSTFVQVRGMGPEGLSLRPEIRLISGRMFQPGKFEVIAGKNMPTVYRDMTVGSQVDLPQGKWKIVGIFESGGDMTEAGLLADADVLSSSLRQPAFKSVWVMLENPKAFDRFRNWLRNNPALAAETLSEQDYMRRVGGNTNALFKGIAYVVGGIMGLGAMFGAINTMYSSVSRRRVEIATLRAIGFGGSAVMFSVLVESLGLAAIGALIGAVFAWAMFSGHLQSLGGVAITLAVTPAMALNGVLFACFLAALGAFFPALRAARQPIATAIRAT
jgi:putative ABC transport system permease protein